jgi:hypothetical protein
VASCRWTTGSSAVSDVAELALPETLPNRFTRSSGRRVHCSDSVIDADAPTLLVHCAVVRPAQGDQIGQDAPAIRATTSATCLQAHGPASHGRERLSSRRERAVPSTARNRYRLMYPPIGEPTRDTRRLDPTAGYVSAPRFHCGHGRGTDVDNLVHRYYDLSRLREAPGRAACARQVRCCRSPPSQSHRFRATPWSSVPSKPGLVAHGRV